MEVTILDELRDFVCLFATKRAAAEALGVHECLLHKWLSEKHGIGRLSANSIRRTIKKYKKA